MFAIMTADIRSTSPHKPRLPRNRLEIYELSLNLGYDWFNVQSASIREFAELKSCLRRAWNPYSLLNNDHFKLNASDNVIWLSVRLQLDHYRVLVTRWQD